MQRRAAPSETELLPPAGRSRHPQSFRCDRTRSVIPPVARSAARTTASAQPSSCAHLSGSVGTMSASPSRELITEVGCSDHWAHKSPPNSTGAKPPRPSRIRSTRCSHQLAESATGNCRTTALNAGCSVSILQVSACWAFKARDSEDRGRRAGQAPDCLKRSG